MRAAPSGESPRDSAGLLSSATSFWLPLGPRIDPSGVAGYPIDFRVKARESTWPPRWLEPRASRLYVHVIQWGLGCVERFHADEGDEWLSAALRAGDLLLAEQDQDGGWTHQFRYPHSLPLPPPWRSAMAQGEGASLLVRLHLETGEERYAEAAIRALAPLEVPTAAGGVQAMLDGHPFLEEYPTQPPSFVLNGTIFALWGLRDVGVGLDSRKARDQFTFGAAALASALHRWDTGWWSRYDLFPRPLPNIASSFYHTLHQTQLEALDMFAPNPEFGRVRNRFASYAASSVNRRRALASKVAYRLMIPRNQLLAHRMPWTRSFAVGRANGERASP